MENNKPYRPSNGTEGMYFEDKFCSNCIHQHPDPEAENTYNCDIFMRAFLHETNEKEYPAEWQYDENDKPTCTAFKKWDWDKNDDGDWILPPGNPDDGDPKQLMLFSIADEVLQNHEIKSEVLK